jgi:hypothetical protein
MARFLVYADDVSTVGRSVRTVKGKNRSFISQLQEEVNADKTKCMVMSRDKNAGRSHSMKTDNSSFERVEEFKYLGRNLKNQNSIHEEIKS